MNLIKNLAIASLSAITTTFVAIADVSAETFSGYIDFDFDRGLLSIDRWYFDVEEAGNVSIATTTDYFDIDPSLIPSGTNFDPALYLFADDGSLENDDLIASDRDSGPNLDALLNLFLEEGNYVVTMGHRNYDPLESAYFEGGYLYNHSYSIDITGATVTKNLRGNLSYEPSFTEIIITPEETASVPESTSLLSLLAIGAFGTAIVRRKKGNT